MKNRDLEIRRRLERFQRLLDERRHAHPGESYDSAFRAVAESTAGAELIANAERSAMTADGVPIQSPRHAALLGKTYPIPHDEFVSLWKKFKASGGKDQTGGGAEGGAPGEPQFRNKEEAKAAFLKEVERLISTGLPRDQAWNLAGNSTAKAAYQAWKQAADEEKNLPADHLRLRRIPPMLSPS